MMVIGVDPGGTTGIFFLNIFHKEIEGRGAIQVGSAAGIDSRREVVMTTLRILISDSEETNIYVAVEEFVRGPRSGRLRSPQDSQLAIDIIGAIRAMPEINRARRPVTAYFHSAATVKRWATTQRLEAAGLIAPTIGEPHARDAARHALFLAVKTGMVPDPLSRKAAR